jgi:hypothetical protein
MVATFTIEAEILVYIEKERVSVLFLRTICFSNSGKPQLALFSRCSNPPAALPHNNRKD